MTCWSSIHIDVSASCNGAGNTILLSVFEVFHAQQQHQTNQGHIKDTAPSPYDGRPVLLFLLGAAFLLAIALGKPIPKRAQHHCNLIPV